MPKQRASLFDAGDTEELDVGSFTPKTSVDAGAPKPEQVRAVTQAAQFVSREPAVPKSAGKVKRAQRRYRTGRNVQLNAKVLQETRDLLYEITDATKDGYWGIRSSVPWKPCSGNSKSRSDRH
jgi:hypothetical protein